MISSPTVANRSLRRRLAAGRDAGLAGEHFAVASWQQRMPVTRAVLNPWENPLEKPWEIGKPMGDKLI